MVQQAFYHYNVEPLAELLKEDPDTPRDQNRALPRSLTMPPAFAKQRSHWRRLRLGATLLAPKRLRAAATLGKLRRPSAAAPVESPPEQASAGDTPAKDAEASTAEEVSPTKSEADTAVIAGVAKQEDVQRVAEDVASLRQQVSGLQELLERMHVKMAYASKKRA